MTVAIGDKPGLPAAVSFPVAARCVGPIIVSVLCTTILVVHKLDNACSLALSDCIDIVLC